MPSKVNSARPETFVFPQIESPAVMTFQKVNLGRTRFCERPDSDDNSVVVRNRPQSLIEGPVGVLAQRNPVARVVVAAVPEFADVCGVEGCLAIQRYHPVTGEGAGVIVSREHTQGERAKLWSAALRTRRDSPWPSRFTLGQTPLGMRPNAPPPWAERRWALRHVVGVPRQFVFGVRASLRILVIKFPARWIRENVIADPV